MKKKLAGTDFESIDFYVTLIHFKCLLQVIIELIDSKWSQKINQALITRQQRQL